MSEPNDVSERLPAVAGMLYPSDGEQCRIEAHALLRNIGSSIAGRPIGALVPHAGWVCSGAIAGQAIATLARGERPDLVVVFGAIHTPLPADRTMLDTHDRWLLPGFHADMNAELRAKLLEVPALFRADNRFHDEEHAVEVEIPLIQTAWPGMEVLPIETPPEDSAVQIGREVARLLGEAKVDAIFLASSDLTHYGPSYGFTPWGVGKMALHRAKENDRRLLDQVMNMTAETIVPHVSRYRNACGAGAIAAMLSACRERGGNSAALLQHANSFETLAAIAPQPETNAVGYAGIVISS